MSKIRKTNVHNDYYKTSIKSMTNEINIQIECSKHDLCPEIYNSTVHEKYTTIDMERMDFTLEDEFENADEQEKIDLIDTIFELLGDLHKNGIYHGDCHTENIMINMDGQMKFIDMGRAGYLKDLPKDLQKYHMIQDYNFVTYPEDWDKDLIEYIEWKIKEIYEDHDDFYGNDDYHRKQEKRTKKLS